MCSRVGHARRPLPGGTRVPRTSHACRHRRPGRAPSPPPSAQPDRRRRTADLPDRAGLRRDAGLPRRRAGRPATGSSTASSASPTSARSVSGDELTATLTVTGLRQIGGADIIAHHQRDHRRRRRPGLHRQGHPRPLVRQGVRHEHRPDPRNVLPEQVFTVTRADLVAYAEASGDHNPIHQDEEVALQRRPARRDRARHVHPGAGRPRRRRRGPTAPRSSSSGASSPARSSYRPTAGPRSWSAAA